MKSPDQKVFLPESEEEMAKKPRRDQVEKIEIVEEWIPGKGMVKKPKEEKKEEEK